MERVAVARGDQTRRVPSHQLSYWAARGWHPVDNQPAPQDVEPVEPVDSVTDLEEVF